MEDGSTVTFLDTSTENIDEVSEYAAIPNYEGMMMNMGYPNMQTGSDFMAANISHSHFPVQEKHMQFNSTEQMAMGFPGISIPLNHHHPVNPSMFPASLDSANADFMQHPTFAFTAGAFQAPNAQFQPLSANITEGMFQQ